MLTQVVVNWLMLSSTYVLLALGITLIFSVMVMMNFTHGSFYMLGAFVLWYCFSFFGINYFVSLILTFFIMFLVGVFVERIGLRPLGGDKIRAIVVTLGFLYIIDGASLIVFGPIEKVVEPVISGILRIGGAALASERLLPTVLGIVLIVGLLLFLQYSKSGRALRATAQDREVASLHGVNPDRINTIAFGIGAGLAGVAAGLMAPVILIHPFLGGPVLWKCFMIVIIGGMGSIPGAILGGVILAAFDSFVATYADPTIAQLAAFLFVIALLIFRPKGLIGVYEL